MARIPSVWKKSDVRKMLAAIDRGSPGGKRDYAILLLASGLGMRASDIRNLKLANLKWSTEKNQSQLEITQSKTGKILYLPLPPEIGWALIEYIKNGRPKVDSAYVFLRHNAPFEALQPNNGLNNIIKKYAGFAKLELTSDKKNGIHSLRHTFASELVKEHIPLETVSGLLGHAKTQSTSAYIKVDTETLRLCALNPMEVIKIEG